MTQRELIIAKLTENGRIINADFVREFKQYSGRNRVTDAWMRSYWAQRGKMIVQFFGETWLENGWRLEDVPVVQVAT